MVEIFPVGFIFISYPRPELKKGGGLLFIYDSNPNVIPMKSEVTFQSFNKIGV
jgi:hypothetical protein